MALEIYWPPKRNPMVFIVVQLTVVCIEMASRGSIYILVNADDTIPVAISRSGPLWGLRFVLSRMEQLGDLENAFINIGSRLKE